MYDVASSLENQYETPVNSPTDIRDIRDFAKNSVEDFHSEYGQSVPRPNKTWKMGDPDSPEIPDIEPHLKLLNQKISDLLRVEERNFEELNNKTVYNEPEPGSAEVFKQLLDLNTDRKLGLLGGSLISLVGGLATGHFLPGTLGSMGLGAYTALQANNLYDNLYSQFIQDFQNEEISGGHYKSQSGEWRIGISSEPMDSDNAFATTGSELFHEFQYQADSPTTTHPYLREGLEEAVRQYCLEIGVEEDIIIPRHEDAHRAAVLAGGFAAHLDEREELTRQDMRDLGLYSDEIEDFFDYFEETGNHVEYDLGASAVLTAAEKFG
ncbi:MAG: hypothetical protein ABEJ03_06080, partial [Candidatus Nanohaloarchaea archaeon]